MEENRYTLTLGDVPAEIISIQQVSVPFGPNQSRIEAGYLLQDRTTLLESEKDENGFYIGGTGTGDMYLKTARRYEPVRNDSGKVTAFRRMSRYLIYFTGEEQEAIFQYGLNTKENLIHDLDVVAQAVKQPEIRAAFSGARDKLEPIPPEECRRLMADIRAAYKGRHEQSIRQRQQAAGKSRRRDIRPREMER